MIPRIRVPDDEPDDDPDEEFDHGDNDQDPYRDDWPRLADGTDPLDDPEPIPCLTFLDRLKAGWYRRPRGP